MSAQLGAVKASPEWYFYAPYKDTWRRFLCDIGRTFATMGDGESLQHYLVGKRGGEFEYVPLLSMRESKIY
jgi:hypothetical protein